MTTHLRIARAAATLIVLACFCMLAGRAGWLGGPAPDEIRSLLLARQAPAEMVVDAPLVNQFPAGYPLALRQWERLGRGLGIPESIHWSRLPGIEAWLAMILAAALLGRAVAGPGAGALLAAALAAGTFGVFSARRLDGAALAGPALAIALLGLLAHARLEQEKRIGFIQSCLLWGVYSLAGAAAAASQRLAGPAVVGLFALWVLLCAVKRMGRTRLLEGGIWAHLFIFVVVFPLFWLTPPDERSMNEIPGLLTGSRSGGSMFASLRLILSAHVTGLHALTLASPKQAGLLAGGALAAALVPAVLLFLRFCFYRRGADGAGEGGARLLAAGGLFVAIFQAALILVMHTTRWGKYYAWPSDGFPAWPAAAIALAGMALWSRPLLPQAAPWRPWIALAPWLAVGLGGQWVELNHERRLASADHALAQELPTSNFYAAPAGLIPYFGGRLGVFGLFPTASLGRQSDATLVRLNPWPLLDAPADTAAWARAKAGQLSPSVKFFSLPLGPGLEFLALQGFDRERAAKLAADGFIAPEPPLTSGTLMQVRPRDLWPGDGWDALEAGPQGETWRWSRREDVRFRLPALLPEGSYVVHLKGMRLGAPKGPARWTMRFHWDWPAYTAEVPEGWFEIAVPVRVSHLYRRCYLDLHHPIAPAAEAAPGSADTRKLGFLFMKLWVTKD